MATELTVQSERAFQKQPHIFLNSKVKSKSKKVGKGGRRWYKDVGLGFKTPKTAIEGSYIGMEGIFLHFSAFAACNEVVRMHCELRHHGNMVDLPTSPTRYTLAATPIFSPHKKCPFTGLVSIRGRILTGTVVSTKMHRTLIIRREYLHYIPKYNRYEKRHKNLAAHVSPAFRVEEGDQVTVGQCRPLSKTVRFNVLRVLPRTGKAVKSFNKF
ncbi:40S ribosomal protein S11-B [Ophidiomyces ophidiicola]|uniref:40S ribosomal protein S11-B n=1 Tax=Ophidiomyces ophidiicola TaxID=1387563 RepID=A0ACB8V4K5_9EURO|nr:40S ribosomal protein S11-B [Ophidiomyces ophidiicola]KAI1914193.1 40S ribosomal protein S11-B [Ophidiomyces ophidiicola]KAI1918797.1 40S ribosomal protein S11-B [Ophidiomyces ophidiicola]KAI1926238.1 40S ribosomal protein S11-B [Ophidiomyces ophidiicola]KAI1946655.1 40S ribosomal protein S11-B [Ophidiomyces ophidiicola]KAI1947487.1 40S ribosomal protein S11-B [Ophidiomyces ophidiicola]